MHIRHISCELDASFFLPETKGAQTYPSLAPSLNETVIEKHFPNSFLETPLLDYLHSQGIDHLVVAGMMTHMCVDATVRAAVDLGFECWLACDACATKDLNFSGQAVPAALVQAAFLAALQDAYADAIPTSAILERLAWHPKAGAQISKKSFLQ